MTRHFWETMEAKSCLFQQFHSLPTKHLLEMKKLHRLKKKKRCTTQSIFFGSTILGYLPKEVLASTSLLQKIIQLTIHEKEKEMSFLNGCEFCHNIIAKGSPLPGPFSFAVSIMEHYDIYLESICGRTIVQSSSMVTCTKKENCFCRQM